MVGPRTLLTAGTQLLLGRWPMLHLFAAVYVKGTGIETTRTEGIETLQHAEGTGLALKRGSLMALCRLRGSGFERKMRVLWRLILFM